MANRFWVGGSGTWDSISIINWSTTSGGVAGASAPTSSDAVFFDANSGSGVCTTLLGSTCSNATLNNSAIQLTLGANHTMSGVFNLMLGVLSLGINTLTSLTFISNNSNARTIDFGSGNITVTGNGASVWNLSTNTNISILGTPVVNAIYAGATGTRSLQNGVAAGASESNAISFNVSAGTDAITLTGASKNVNFTGFSGTLNLSARSIYGSLTCSAGMTLNAGSSTTTFAATSGTQQITTNNKTFDFPIAFNGIGGTMAFQDALTQGSTRAFTITNGTVQLKNGVTSTVGAFATSGTNQKFLQSTLAGAQATISQVTGIVSVGYLTIKDIIATGGATWNSFTANNNVDAGNNLGWDFSTQLGRYMYTRRKNKRILP